MYKPKEMEHLTTALKLLIPTYEEFEGRRIPVYPAAPYADDPLIFANFKTKGGTETEVNGVYSILDTAQVVTWYRPDIKSDCRIVRLSDMAVFDIKNEPENVEERGQYLIMKVERVKGAI